MRRSRFSGSRTDAGFALGLAKLPEGEDPRLRLFADRSHCPARVSPRDPLDRASFRPARRIALPCAPGALAQPGTFSQCSAPGGLPGRTLKTYLLSLYQDDPDPEVHSAAGSLLKIWGRGEQVRLAEQGSVSARPVGARRWYVARDGLTMVLLPGKTSYRLGSPMGGAGAEEQRRPTHRRCPPPF